jgi:Superinfection immunity protein
MRKALTEINIQIHRMLSDITGYSGMAKNWSLSCRQVSITGINTVTINHEYLNLSNLDPVHSLILNSRQDHDMHPLVLFLYGVWTIAVYVLPTAIAFSRKKKHRWIIAVINILGGWLYGVPWLVSLVWALLGLQTDGSKGFKAWPLGLGLFVAPFLFGALGAAINPKKETKEVVQVSARSAVQAAAVSTLTATPAQERGVGAVAASTTSTATPVEEPAATPTPVATPKPTVTPKPVATPSPTPKPGPLHKINNDVLAAYSKEDFTEMMDMYAIHDTDAVKQMVSEGKVVGLRRGALVYLEDVDLRDGIVNVRPKGSTTTVWIPSQFLNY